MSDGRSEDPAQDLQRTYSNYKVYDQHYNEIGRVDDIFVDANDQPEYIGVKMGFLGLKSTVVPIELVRVNDKRGLIEVAESEDFIKNGPSFDDDQVISPEHESEILSYYGLNRASQDRERPREGYAAGGSPVDLEYGERTGPPDRDTHREEPRRSYREDSVPESTTSPVSEPGDEPRQSYREDPAPERDLARESARETAREPEREPAREVRDENEVRVQRTEEELRAGVRQREAGSVNVRKRVHTDREQLRVPKRREEVSVERVPVEEQSAATTGDAAPGVESTEDEIRIPIVEEEIVVEKKPVVKEELRIRKDVVQEEEVVQADLRKEEIEVEDETRRRDR